MNELEVIGSTYIMWLQAHRNAYQYHKAYLDMSTKQVETDWGIENMLDEKPPEYTFEQWQKVNQLYKSESDKAEKLYALLLEKADLYIGRMNLGEI